MVETDRKSVSPQEQAGSLKLLWDASCFLLTSREEQTQPFITANTCGQRPPFTKWNVYSRQLHHGYILPIKEVQGRVPPPWYKALHQDRNHPLHSLKFCTEVKWTHFILTNYWDKKQGEMTQVKLSIIQRRNTKRMVFLILVHVWGGWDMVFNCFIMWWII